MPLPTVSVPRYNIRLPMTGKMVNFRPFVVGEEKLLLIAIESSDSDLTYNTIKQIISTCTDNQLNIEELPGPDLEYLFIALRIKSVGESVEPIVKCPKCSKDFNIKINLHDIKLSGDSKPSQKIMLDSEVGIVLNYPSIELAKRFTKTLPKGEDVKAHHIIDLISECVESIFDANETHSRKDFTTQECVEFLEKLPDALFKPVIEFFESIPTLVFEQTLTCPHCHENVTFKLEGIEDFFS